MRSFFYTRLAWFNIKNNSRTYVPYIWSCLCTIAMYYIMFELSTNPDLQAMSGGNSLKSLLELGTYVIAFFAVIFIFYTNSFLMKRRKAEFGLYNVLGMEKRHISLVILLETIFVALICIVSGVLGGIILSKLMFLILLKILNFEVSLGFHISIPGVYFTLILFSAIFTFTLIKSICQIYISKPIELIKGSRTGEREPKTKWILTIIGLICLGGGYYIALTVKSPLSALNLFFLAVILVIIGTYCLFTAISIVILKALRKNKAYYYRPNHFTSVSGMIYRMKQNAAGLASICILATAVLVMVSTTVSMYAGMDDILRTRYPRDMMVEDSVYSSEQVKNIKSVTNQVLSKRDVRAENPVDYRYLSIFAINEGDAYFTDEITDYSSTNLTNLNFIPLEDYNSLTGQSIKLKDDEILIYSFKDQYEEDKLSVLDMTFKIKSQIDYFPVKGSDSITVVSSHYIVVKDMDLVQEMSERYAEAIGEENPAYNYYYGFDLSTSTEESLEIYEDLVEKMSAGSSKSVIIDSKAESKQSFYAVYGGLFFLGIFLSVLFIMATVMIIYYKQISEGYDDKKRFEIMQKVGMSQNEVKKTISSQILTVFFLPLLTAAIHIAFAFKVITKLLSLLNMTNIALFAWCTVGTILVFAVFYALIYAATARVYYSIVSRSVN